MRALKAVLTMAGGLKRSARDEAEEVVVIRALRDANLPKLLTEVSASNMKVVGVGRRVWGVGGRCLGRSAKFPLMLPQHQADCCTVRVPRGHQAAPV
jgi:hypothetical protein